MELTSLAWARDSVSNTWRTLAAFLDGNSAEVLWRQACVAYSPDSLVCTTVGVGAAGARGGCVWAAVRGLARLGTRAARHWRWRAPRGNIHLLDAMLGEAGDMRAAEGGGDDDGRGAGGRRRRTVGIV